MIQNRGTLARLMAIENITVEHRQIPTAAFDVINRILILPTWKEMSADLYDLLRAHEVGHALETPAEGWHGVTLANKNLRSFLNVVEDARIEKLIKNRYPGLKPSFIRGYKELFDNDFFGVSKKKLSSLLLVDRINLHFKIGSYLNVPFSEEEMYYVKKVADAQTWQDVVNIAKEIYSFDEQELKNQLQEMKLQSSPGTSNNFEDYDFDDIDEDNLDEADEADNSSESSNSPKRNQSKIYDPFKNRSKDLDEWYEQQESVESLTDSSFREREKEFLDSSSTPRVYIDVPAAKLSKIIIPYKTILEQFVWLNPDIVSRKEIVDHKINFLATNKRFVDHMVRDFELKRNARQLARAGTSKTGALNMKKLHQFKLTDDIFQRLTIVPNGKNHGMILVFDQSGSMADFYGQTIEQIILLAMFCRKVKVPFHVYGFTDNTDHIRLNNLTNYQDYNKEKLFTEEVGEMQLNNPGFRLREYFSHTQSSTDFKKMVDCMLVVAACFRMKSSFYTSAIPMSERLHGTPLNHAIAAMIDIVPKFKKAHRLDIVNTIFLTDGESNTTNEVVQIETSRIDGSLVKRSRIAVSRTTAYLVIRHKQTKQEVEINHSSMTSETAVTTGLLNLLKNVTGARTIGYFVNNNYKHYTYDWIRNNKPFITPQDAQLFVEKTYSESRKNGFWVKQDPKLTGYDCYYSVTNKFLDFKDEEFEVDSKAKVIQIRKAFLKMHGDKRKHRMLLSNFIEKIA